MNVPYFDIIKIMTRLNLLHRIFIQRCAEQNGLYFGQHPILEYVEKHDHCTQREVADFLRVSPPSIAKSLKRMQKNGLLKKSTDQNDLRYNRISITDKGREISKKCRTDFNQVDEQMFRSFTEEECRQIYDFFGRMIKNLSTDEFIDQPFFSLVAEMNKMHLQAHKEEQNFDS